MTDKLEETERSRKDTMQNKAIHGGDIYRNQVRLDFSVNVNPLGMPDGVEEALHEAVSGVQEYPDMEVLALKESLAKKLAVPKENLLFGNGASELLMAVVHALHPTKIMIPSPSFYGYQHAAKAAGSKVIPFMLREENGFLLTEELFTVLEQERPELLILANPNNPTGVLASKEYLKQLLPICRETNTWLLLDECFIEFCEGQDSMLSEIGKEDRLLLLRAFTKSYAIPGVRLGYLIGSAEEFLTKIREQLPEWNLSVFAQKAGQECLSAENAAYLTETVRYVKKERQFLTDELRKMGIRVFPGEANFLLLYCEEKLYEKLLRSGILIRDCSNFEGLSKGYYRIAVKRHKENLQLLEAIKECLKP